MDNLFNASEASLIKGIHIPRVLREDALAWSKTIAREHSARTTYHVMRNFLGVVPRNIYDRQWLLIRSATIAPKLKVFLWRVAHGILPMAPNFARRNIPILNRCCVCDGERETIFHD